MNVKEFQQPETKWTTHDVLRWFRDDVRREDPEDWVRKFVTVSKDGTIEIRTDLSLVGKALAALPPRLHVKGNVLLMGTRLPSLRPDLRIDGHLFLSRGQKHLEDQGMRLKMEGLIQGDVVTI